jgi:hypothetical protein
MTPENIGEVLVIFLTFLDQLKLNHSANKDADILVYLITLQVYRCIEILQVSTGNKISLNSTSSKISLFNPGDHKLILELVEFKKWLINGLSCMLTPFDKELSNIIDGMVVNLNKTIYLFNLI